MRIKLFFVVFFFAINLVIKAQVDTAFWFAAPDISAGLGDSPVKLYITTYSQASTVTVTQPANGAFAPITINVAANTADSIDLTPFLASIENATANTALNNGLKISATQNIGVIYAVNSATNKEFFSLKGAKALGTDFYTPFQNFWVRGTTTPASYSSFEIVATENATTVLITPRTAITGHAQNVTYSVTLNKGQTYSGQDVSASVTNTLAGSIISADKPVAVTISSNGINNGGVISSVGDQITNSSFIGNDYVINKGTGVNEKVFILATQNNTNLTISDGTTTSRVINWSETSVFDLTAATTFIHSTKPIYVLHVSGNGGNMSAAQVPQFYCAGTYDATFVRTTADTFSINVYTRSGFEGNFTLNGNATLIPASAFSPVPGTSNALVSAKIYFTTAQVPVGTHVRVSNSADVFGLGIQNGSSTSGNGYAYVTEFISYPFVDAGTSSTICANTSINLNGQVGGGSVTGVWNTNGYGTFSNGFTGLTNTYVPNSLDTTLHPVYLVLSSTGPCPVKRDTLFLDVTPQPYVNASVDQTVCANNANVNLSGVVSYGSTSGIWTASSGASAGSFLPSNTNLNTIYIPSTTDKANGSVTLYLTSTNNGSCLAVKDSMKITIAPGPTANAGPVTTSVCSNNPNVTLNGLVTGSTTTGSWSSAGLGIFSPNNLQLNGTYQPSASDVANGSVMLYLQSTNNGICNAVKDSIKVLFTQPAVVNAGNNSISCKNNIDINLAGTIVGVTNTGVWSGGAGTYGSPLTNLTNHYTPTASEISSGSVTLTLTSTNNSGCLAVSDNVTLNFVEAPIAAFSNTNVCQGLANNFNQSSLPGAGIITDYDWSFGEVGATDTIQNPTHVYSSAGTFNASLIITNSFGCSDTITHPATVYPVPVADFDFNLSCINNNYNVAFTDQSTIGTPDNILSWKYAFGDGAFAIIPSPNHNYNLTGNYIVSLTITSNHTCRDTFVDTLFIPVKPNAGFFFNVSSGLNLSSQADFFDQSTNASSYLWTFENGTDSAAIASPSHLYTSNGTYVVEQFVYDAYGCVDSTSDVIVINNVTTVLEELIPNAISPNGDGKNDVWKLNFINNLYPQATIEVYNRWGERVYASTGYNNPWDGTYKGEALAVGTYYYVINLNSSTIEKEPIKGSVLLIR